MKRLFIRTLGCQMNELDSERLGGMLAGRGFRAVADPAEADVILLNTCSVREHAEEKAMSLLGEFAAAARPRRPVLGVIGCMAERLGEAFRDRRLRPDLVVGPTQLHRIPDLVERIEVDRRFTAALGHEDWRTLPRTLGVRPQRHRAYVEIVHGCDHACTFCVVPTTRGPAVSRPLAELEEEVRALAGDGCREVILLGQTVNDYGRSLGDGTDLATLLDRLDRIDGVERIRFVTSHPTHMRRRLMEGMRDLPSVCEHLPLPFQSGSDRILLAMRRGYTTARYLEITARLRATVPDVEIGTDVIVGYPGETEEDFAGTERMLREVGFQSAFLFKYSPRPGTDAGEGPDDVPKEVKESRHARLEALQREISLERNRAVVGRTVEVLVDGPSRRDAARLTGRTRDNRIVAFPGPEAWTGRLVRVRVDAVTPFTLLGEVEAGENRDIPAILLDEDPNRRPEDRDPVRAGASPAHVRHAPGSSRTPRR